MVRGQGVVHPSLCAGRCLAQPHRGAGVAVGRCPPVPLGVAELLRVVGCGGAGVSGPHGRRVIGEQHLRGLARGPDQPRLRQLRDQVGELVGARRLVSIGGPLQTERVLGLFVRHVGRDHPRARRLLIFLLGAFAHLGAARQARAARRVGGGVVGSVIARQR
ncbi:hypothetical protein D9M68_862010 [compost metagenome]